MGYRSKGWIYKWHLRSFLDRHYALFNRNLKGVIQFYNLPQQITKRVYVRGNTVDFHTAECLQRLGMLKFEKCLKIVIDSDQWGEEYIYVVNLSKVKAFYENFNHLPLKIDLAYSSQENG